MAIRRYSSLRHLLATITRTFTVQTTLWSMSRSITSCSTRGWRPDMCTSWRTGPLHNVQGGQPSNECLEGVGSS
ncbi:hypothetical protein CCUS01_03361 [Colletotrichum cuscutae]|uniref:Uncharacterized protein n=1 Tax=Colletotrichum cuscutae TaxID=1209917 RepID=A0AAI9Y8D5_9PEZI|nr:hypothetical protein CCUS01_03361 [Colletotrichum cuscutae]